MLGLIEQSPFALVKRHAQTVGACVKCLQPFFEAICGKCWDDAEVLFQQIGSLEEEADQLKGELRLLMHHDLYLPVSRGHLLHLLSAQDNIASTAEDVAGLIMGRQMVLPGALHDDLESLLREGLAACAAIEEAVCCWVDALELGGAKESLAAIMDLLKLLHEREERCDALQMTLRRALYALEKDLPPVEVMFLYHLIKEISSLADEAETTGNRLLSLLSVQ